MNCFLSPAVTTWSGDGVVMVEWSGVYLHVVGSCGMCVCDLVVRESLGCFWLVDRNGRVLVSISLKGESLSSPFLFLFCFLFFEACLCFSFLPGGNEDKGDEEGAEERKERRFG